MKRIYQPPGHAALLFYGVATTDKSNIMVDNGVKAVTVHITGLDLSYTGASCCDFQRKQLRTT